MFSRGLYLTPLFVGASLLAHAQDAVEALNLSNVGVQGTARSMGFGSTLGSIGGDFAALSVNPAGIGVYRMSELTFTPSMKFNTAESQYQGSASSASNSRFNINNFGIVLTSAPSGKRYDQRCWKAVSFAFGMNRVGDFNRDYTYQGKNMSSSMTQTFEADANFDTAGVKTYSPSNGLGYMGYQAYLIDPTLSGRYTSVVPFGGGINQWKEAKQRGRITEYVISFGGNYKEKLLVGGTLGFTGFKYDYQSRYSEWLSEDNHSPNPNNFSSFRLEQNLSLNGSGINLNLGGIYKISDNFRIGAAFHTPTYYNIDDLYRPYMTSLVNGGETILSVDNGFVQENAFKYTFVTPWRGVLSAAFVKKGLGFVTVDYEYIGYNSMRFYYPYGYDMAGYALSQEETDMNNYLQSLYKGASNLRVGVEALAGQYFMVRGGFGYFGSPYRNSPDYGYRMDFSGGIGFHFENFFTDLAYVRSIYTEQQTPYMISDYRYVMSGGAASPPVATIDFAINNIAWTVGLKF
jgi:hypothetical protein